MASSRRRECRCPTESLLPSGERTSARFPELEAASECRVAWKAQPSARYSAGDAGGERGDSPSRIHGGARGRLAHRSRNVCRNHNGHGLRRDRRPRQLRGHLLGWCPVAGGASCPRYGCSDEPRSFPPTSLATAFAMPSVGHHVSMNSPPEAFRPSTHQPTWRPRRTVTSREPIPRSYPHGPVVNGPHVHRVGSRSSGARLRD